MKFELKHGGGGQATFEVIKLIKEKLPSAQLEPLDDAALLQLSGSFAFTTDSFTVKPLFFRGGDIGKLAVAGTVNDLVSMGAEPLFLSLAFIVEEGFKMEEFGYILDSIEETCRSSGVKVVTGDTKVVEKGSGDGIFINTSGIGRVLLDPPPSPERLAVGDRILITGPVGDHGACVMIQRNFPDFATELQSDCRPLWPAMKQVLGPEIKFMRDPSRGGLAAVLNEMVHGRDFAAVVEEEHIPIRDEVKGICEILGLDPLSLACEGQMLLVVERGEEKEVLGRLRSAGFPSASVIGELIARPAGKVVLRTSLGSERLLMMPSGENLPRIC